MKKLIITLLFAAGVISCAYAQKPSFGFKAGLNFPTLSSDIDSEDATGFHAGAILHVPIKKLGVMAEATYSKEGNKKLDLGYVNVPLMLTYKLVPGLRLHLGPQFKINVNANFDAKEGLESGSVLQALDLSTEEKAVEDDIKTLNFDGVAGIEYKLPGIGVFAQARYVFGLSDLGDNTEAKQNIFQLSVGYRF